MDVRLVIFSSFKLTCQVRIWPLTHTGRNWAKVYTSMEQCVAELSRLCHLTSAQGALVVTFGNKRTGQVLDIKTDTKPNLLIAAGFTEQMVKAAPWTSRGSGGRWAGHNLDWLP